jgi:hemolysin activation/secretion protein
MDFFNLKAVTRAFTLCSLFLTWACYAEQTPHFKISHYEIAGNSKISTESLMSALAHLTGDNQDFSTIQTAIAILQQVYKDAGYETIKVVIPKQEIDEGVIHLQIIEARLQKLEIQGNQNYDDKNIQNATPALQSGETPNIRNLAANLRLGNESKFKQTQVTFRQGEDPHSIDAVIKVSDKKPWLVSTSIDNTGTDRTGNWRLGFAFMHANLFNRDHTLSAQFLTSPDNWDNVQIFGMNYRIPVYSLGDSLEFNANHSSVNAGVVNTTDGSFGINGSGDFFGIHFVHLLPRFLDWDQRLNFGADYRYYHNKISFQGFPEQNLLPDSEIHPLSVNYIGFYRGAEREWGMNFGIYQNIPGGEKGDTKAIKATRLKADAAYNLVRYGISFTEKLPLNWQIHAEFNGQHTDDALISGEQFGLGGINSVRGFQERILANDKGYRAVFEFYSPDIAKLFEWENFNLRGLIFFNAGNAWRNFPLPGENKFNHLSSIGIGIRSRISSDAHFRLDWSNILDANGINKTGQKHIQASLILVF